MNQKSLGKQQIGSETIIEMEATPAQLQRTKYGKEHGASY